MNPKIYSAGNVYLADNIFIKEGAYLRQFGKGEGKGRELSYPSGISIDS